MLAYLLEDCRRARKALEDAAMARRYAESIADRKSIQHALVEARLATDEAAALVTRLEAVIGKGER